MGVVSIKADTLVEQRELEHEGQAIAEFIRILTQEQIALKSFDIDAVNDLSIEKARQLGVLGRHAEIRNQRLRSAGCSQDAEGMRAWLAERISCPGIIAAWTRVAELAREAQGQNEINGWLVSIQMQRNGRQLEFLNKMASNEPIYSAEGLAHASVRQRSLGEA